MSAWLGEGSCEDFAAKYSAFKMELMSMEQIETMLDRLMVDAAIRDVLSGKG